MKLFFSLYLVLSSFFSGGLEEHYDFLPSFIPSLTPYSPIDREESISFIYKLDQRPFQRVPKLRARLLLVTDYPEGWPVGLIRDIVSLSNWYFSRCRIEISVENRDYRPILFSKGFFLDSGPLIKRKFRDKKFEELLRPYLENRAGFTLVILTKSVIVPAGKGKTVSLLGLSHFVWVFSSGRLKKTPKVSTRPGYIKLQAIGKKLSSPSFVIPAVWVRPSPIITTFVHELGHRFGLPHRSMAYNLMLTGYLIRRSLSLLWTSLLGYFEPFRFSFSPRDCSEMYRKLKAEFSRQRGEYRQ